MKNEIEIKLGSDKIPACKFVDSVRSFFNILSGIVQNIKEDDENIQWNVEVKEGSARILAIPDEDIFASKLYNKTVKTLFSGFEDIKNKKYPKYFNDSMIKEFKTIAKSLSNSESVSVPVSIFSDQREFNFKKEYIHYADNLLKRKPIEDHGTLEGILNTITQRSGLKIFITDEIENKTILCILTEKVREDAINGFGKRVSVSGMIKYSDYGTPQRISVENIYIFPDDNKLPSYIDVKGILN